MLSLYSILEHVTECASQTCTDVGLSVKQVSSSEKDRMQKWKVNVFTSTLLSPSLYYVGTN